MCQSYPKTVFKVEPKFYFWLALHEKPQWQQFLIICSELTPTWLLCKRALMCWKKWKKSISPLPQKWTQYVCFDLFGELFKRVSVPIIFFLLLLGREKEDEQIKTAVPLVSIPYGILFLPRKLAKISILSSLKGSSRVFFCH